MEGEYQDDLRVAWELANIADSITMDRFEADNLKVKAKPDLTPVSDADLAVERAIRTYLNDHCPTDDIVGEEFGGNADYVGRQWVIDPIDGTKNFVRRVPTWATLIALMVDGIPRMCVISAPALQRRWWAAEGAGAYRCSANSPAKQIHVSEVSELRHASISFSSLIGWKRKNLMDNFINMMNYSWRMRGYGDFFSYCLMAEGAVDVAAEPEVCLWDLAALDILVREAGGRFSSLDGRPGPHSGEAVATNALLHDQVLRAINLGELPPRD
ncbi:MAG: inositol monophosphatase family protein [Lawsonella sp.]|uniref:inositol monophosphatase family protein n=1 Tax=Lawsonella sp. TaxID=2041415 RepID=UPI00256D534B|nr:inositol monophosphatase family protein [Lawsonella sp.]MBS6413977.1 histidinol-phosphatase [Mycobacteriales bacterium]MDY2978494.1 inositol monophosphatase family protein [Lawsonella sp.]